MTPMSFAPMTFQCESCNVGDEPGELQITELQQIPWAYISDVPSAFYQSAPGQKVVPRGLAPLIVPAVGSAHISAVQQEALHEKPRRLVDRSAYYSGQWLGDVRHGQGKLERSKWGCYEGQFVNGKATGSGHFVKSTGDVYTGQWRDDRASGHGHYVHCDGSTYHGQWDADLKNGRGVETWPDRSTYEGDFVSGRKHGHGTYHASDKSSFDGQFRDDMMDGNGQYVFADGRVYSGQWERSRMMGDGFMQWLDGRRYVGQYKDDKKWGFGCFSWADGRAYEGQWIHGKQHGQGEFINKKGKRWKGDWSCGKVVGTGMGSLPGRALELSCPPSVSTKSLPRAFIQGVIQEGDLPSSMDEQSSLSSKLDIYMSARQEPESAALVQRGVGDIDIDGSLSPIRTASTSYIVDIDGREVPPAGGAWPMVEQRPCLDIHAPASNIHAALDESVQLQRVQRAACQDTEAGATNAPKDQISEQDESETAKTIMTVTFTPGRLGMRFHDETGTVLEVIQNARAQEAGVKVGMRMFRVDGEQFSQPLFKKKVTGTSKFVVSFVFALDEIVSLHRNKEGRRTKWIL